MYKKPIMLRIVGLNYDNVIYQVKIKNEWKQFIKTTSKFVHMMFVLFPDLMKRCKYYDFADVYHIANWLYNYGEAVKPCETYIFYNK